MVEFVEVCAFFMVSEVFVSNHFRTTITVNFCRSFRDNYFCEILFALKRAGHLCLAHDVITFASNYYEDIFSFDDLVSAPSTISAVCGAAFSVFSMTNRLKMINYLAFVFFYLLCSCSCFMDFSNVVTSVPAFHQPVAFPPASAEGSSSWRKVGPSN